MGTAVGTFSARTNHRIRLETQLASQNVAGNYSTINWQLYAEKTSSSSSYYLSNGGSGSVNIGGNVYGVAAWQYDFRSQTTILLASGSTNIGHASDGTLSSYGFSASVTAPGTLGSASCSGAESEPTIPRATQPTVTPASGNTGTTFSIGVVAASSAFYHDIDYSVDGGTTWVSIVANLAGTTTSQTWTPASTLFPNSGGATATIRVITHATSGGTVIGTKTVALPLTVPSSVVPTISSVLFADSQTSSPDLPTMMGGVGRYVQGWSKLIPTVTAAGAGGSTVTGSQVSLNGQVTSTGVAFNLPVNLSGSVPFSAIATDSRGRTSDPYVNTVTVKAYNFPSLPTPTVQRTSDAAGLIPSPTGTYLCITPLASVSDLTFGGVQKNLLEWQVRIKPAGGSFTTVQAWTNATVSGNTWTTKYVAAGPYLSSLEYVVEVSIRDVFGKNGYDTPNTVKVLTVNVASEFVFMDWDGNGGIGLGKYLTNGMLDVAGDIYQGGYPVVDFNDAATTSTPGIAQIATTAEVVAGTVSTKFVTPATLVQAGAQVGVVDASWTYGKPSVLMSTGPDAGTSVSAFIGRYEPNPGDTVLVQKIGASYYIMAVVLSSLALPRAIPLTMPTGWISYNKNFTTASDVYDYGTCTITKTSSGMVWMTGLMYNNTGGTVSNATLFTLAPAFRPLQRVRKPTYTTTGWINLIINTDGTVVMDGSQAAGSAISLSNVAYPTDPAIVWTNLTAQTPWAAVGSPAGTPRVGVDSVGRVWVGGEMKSGTTAAPMTNAVPTAMKWTGGIGLFGSAEGGSGARYGRVDVLNTGVINSGTPVSGNTNRSIDVAYTPDGFPTQALQRNGSDYGSGYNPLSLQQLADGSVMLKGLIQGVAVSGIIAYVPRYLRPDHNVIFAAGATDTAGRVDVRSTDGAIVLMAGTATWASVEGLIWIPGAS